MIRSTDIKHFYNMNTSNASVMYSPALSFNLTPFLMTPYDVMDAGHHRLRVWLVGYMTPCSCLNQYWLIVNCVFRNKLHWNVKMNTKFHFRENAFENTVTKMADIVSLPWYSNMEQCGFLGFKLTCLWVCVCCECRIWINMPYNWCSGNSCRR